MGNMRANATRATKGAEKSFASDNKSKIPSTNWATKLPSMPYLAVGQVTALNAGVILPTCVELDNITVLGKMVVSWIILLSMLGRWFHCQKVRCITCAVIWHPLFSIC